MVPDPTEASPEPSGRTTHSRSPAYIKTLPSGDQTGNIPKFELSRRLPEPSEFITQMSKYGPMSPLCP